MVQILKSLSSKKRIYPTLPLGVVLALSLTLSACASAPMAPTLSLQAAEQAITTAEQDQVAEYASYDLSQAREKLAAANVAVQKKEMVLAKRLAEESLVDAQLATAKTGESKAEKINLEMQESTRTLKEEMGRGAGS